MRIMKELVNQKESYSSKQIEYLKLVRQPKQFKKKVNKVIKKLEKMRISIRS